MASIPFICVLDFEANTEKARDSDLDIIEFPSILLKFNYTTLNYDEIGTFSSFVRPKINHILTTFCKDLTAITQLQINSADDFPTVMNRHYEWLRSIIIGQGFVLTDVVILTCGEWDLKTALVNECTKYGILPKRVYTSYLNVKDLFMHIMKTTKNLGMPRMLAKLKLQLVGHHHSGFDDSKNIARIVQALCRKGLVIDKRFIKRVDPSSYNLLHLIQ